MQKKIDQNSLILPPYISTSWKSVLSLSMQKQTLEIELSNGRCIRIPDLDAATIQEIFQKHALFLEQGETKNKNTSSMQIESIFPFKLPLDGNLDTIDSMMHHNPHQANSPNLPKEMLAKITSMMKFIHIDMAESFAKPEPHCNCPFCQVSRAVHTSQVGHEENLDDPVDDAELNFRSWDIEKKGDYLYDVTNPCDKKELYHVYLGDPIGCTCGEKNCEHIKAVLNT